MFDNFVWASLGIGWLEDVVNGRRGALPFEAVVALSQTNLGRLEHAIRLKQKAAEQYGKAIRATAIALKKLGNATYEQVFLSVLLLVLLGLHYPYRQWEAFLERGQGAEGEQECAATLEMDRAAVINHVEGLRNLVDHIGPKGFQSRGLRSFFDVLRMLLVSARFHLEKPAICRL
jgi:uncharacterized membrane protein